MTQKIELRDYYRALRKQISSERRDLASKKLFDQLSKITASKILSFASFGAEIDLTLLNHLYAAEGRLVLPELDPDEQNLDSIDLVLVPGLAFDEKGYRLGYGKGYYDRLLSRIPQVHTIGVGFAEQKSLVLLPIDSWDVPVKQLLLT